MGKKVILWSRSLSAVMSTVLSNSQKKLTSKLIRQMTKEKWFELTCKVLLSEYCRILKQQPGYKLSKESWTLLQKLLYLFRKNPLLKEKESTCKFIFQMSQGKFNTESVLSPEDFLKEFTLVLLSTCQEIQNLLLQDKPFETTTELQVTQLQESLKCSFKPGLEATDRRTWTEQWVFTGQVSLSGDSAMDDLRKKPRKVTFQEEANQVFIIDRIEYPSSESEETNVRPTRVTFKEEANKVYYVDPVEYPSWPSPPSSFCSEHGDDAAGYPLDIHRLNFRVAKIS